MCSCSTFLSSMIRLLAILVRWLRCGRIFADTLLIGNVLFLLRFSLLNSFGAEPLFLGNQSCSSSGCHGGAGAQQNQSLIWTRQDPHSRAAATLSSARSKRLAEILKIGNPISDRNCTSCHAPWHGLAADLLPSGAVIQTEAVSCESCHGPARDWIRSHTRKDLNRSEKGIDGLRDLLSFYNRANSCVACHQVIDPKLLAAGHPELIFEMDGQTRAMPPHWTDKDPSYKGKSWLSGQAVALRELTAQVIEQQKVGTIAPPTFHQWQAALWIIARAFPQNRMFASDTNLITDIQRLTQLHRDADSLAMQTSIQLPENPRTLMTRLSATRGDFSSPLSPLIASHRAERLALAIDRLANATGLRPDLNESIEELFTLVQSRPDFVPAKFAESLQILASKLRSTESPTPASGH